MRHLTHFVLLAISVGSLSGAKAALELSSDPQQKLERTCFQTGLPWSGLGNLGSDVAIVYGIGADFPQRLKTWQNHGYRTHLMTGVAWGAYQDYISGVFDGRKHQGEEQMDRNANPHSHGGDIFYMCPSTSYGNYLCAGIQRALDAGVEAIHLEEPEFWVQDGYEEGFKREWQDYYHTPWQPPHSSVDAQWRASKLKYFLYRRVLQQVFDFVQDYNRRSGRKVRCYVPSHSLLNYAHWRIVSPESSLARLKGCDGYIAQSWTGTARTPNMYRGRLRERTFETAFLEYGAMQNLVRSTGRTVWYLNDPVEDDPNHTWDDYRSNWESTMVASLFQPEVWRYEVAPWPERVFGGRYRGQSGEQEVIPLRYALEIQTVINALNNMNQSLVQWDCGTTGIGLLVSDSLMFERGDPEPTDPHLSHVYGLALPLLKRGIPITPVQLENITLPNYLDHFRLLILTYQGMKPLTADVHISLAAWVKRGGTLVVVDDDADPYSRVHEWWNSSARSYSTPREHLFELLGLYQGISSLTPIGKGSVSWLRENPAKLAGDLEGDTRLVTLVKEAALAARLKWRETNYLLLRRGPYLIAAGLDESTSDQPKVLRGHFVNLFDPELRVQEQVKLLPGSRLFLFDLDSATGAGPSVFASACKCLVARKQRSLSLSVQGVAGTPAILLLRAPSHPPKSVTLDGEPLKSIEYSAHNHLVWICFTNAPYPRALVAEF